MIRAIGVGLLAAFVLTCAGLVCCTPANSPPTTDAEAGITVVIPCPGAAIFVVDASVPKGPGK